MKMDSANVISRELNDNFMRYDDLQEKCKECEHMKPWSLDMSGNHMCMCKKHQLDYFSKRTDKCGDYEPLHDDDVNEK